tara:strand:+ start:101 stop:565 length:465 start_codon:yes stop_codon:yes gene_type:complete
MTSNAMFFKADTNNYKDEPLELVQDAPVTFDLSASLDHPRVTNIHFFPDGSVTVDLAEAGTWQEAALDDIITKAADKVAVDVVDLEEGYNPRGYGGIHQDNKTGHRGITATASGKYRADITFNRKQTNLGTFATYEEAVEARLAAEQDCVFSGF